MKRILSLFIILLANLLILVHAVVPHHHHNKVFAAVVNILDTESQTKLQHAHDARSHHHPITGKPEECLIDEACAAVIRLDQDDHASIAVQHLDFNTDLADISASIQVPDVCQTSVSYEYPTYGVDIHLRHISCAGLRAPPTC